MNLREAAQAALEALESLFSGLSDDTRPKRCSDAIVTLRAALAQPDPEPVAWRWRRTEPVTPPGFAHMWVVTSVYPPVGGVEVQPLYTAPPTTHPDLRDVIERAIGLSDVAGTTALTRDLRAALSSLPE
jgi:hypothetical protein